MIKRLVSNANYELVVDAAKKYVKGLDHGNYNYIYLKPYDHTPYNRQYFIDMYSTLNLIEAMHIKPSGKVLEVGSGAGWVTEILTSLGFHVYSLEPCGDFIEIAKQKLQSYSEHLRYKCNAEFNNTTLEESNFDENSFDAILFMASLHHVVDEVVCMDKCYKYLKPGGVIGIGQESSYNVDSPLLMSMFLEETERTGVLENPFTKEYLDYLLKERGFIEITRYRQANGLFPIGQEAELNELCGDNTLTAIKPYSQKTTLDPQAIVKAEIVVLSSCVGANKVQAELKIKNTGESVWISNPWHKKGYVTIALGDMLKEAHNRIYLPRDISPGEEFEIKAVFFADDPEDLKFDLINEGYFWFSQMS